jgi:hypothetical protein
LLGDVGGMFDTSTKVALTLKNCNSEPESPTGAMKLTAIPMTGDEWIRGLSAPGEGDGGLAGIRDVRGLHGLRE